MCQQKCANPSLFCKEISTEFISFLTTGLRYLYNSYFKTGMFLWEKLYYKKLHQYVCRFSALASHYKDFHLFNYEDEYLDNSGEWLTPTAERIAEGWLTYSLLEIKQRYNILGVNSLS